MVNPFATETAQAIDPCSNSANFPKYLNVIGTALIQSNILEILVQC